MRTLRYITKNFDHRIFTVVFLFVLVLVVLPDSLSPFGAHHAHAAFTDWAKQIWDDVISLPGKGVAWVADNTFGLVFKWVAEFISWCATTVLLICGFLLDYSLIKTLDSDVYKNLAIINSGWTIVRDLANMFFIFILLYIAIQTILGLMGHQTKVLLRNIIIAALLINFSLFITKVVIDASNILALGFYLNIQTTVQPSSGPPVTEYGPARALIEGLNLQTLDAKDNPRNPKFDAKPSETQTAFIYLGGAILKLVAAYVFVAGAFIFIIRSIVFIFCMIFSPFAFLGFVLPRMRSVTTAWWSALIDNALVAPVFCFMIYLVATIIRNKDLLNWSGSQNARLAAGLSGDIANFSIFYSYFVLIGLMIGTLIVSKKVASSTAGMATSFAKKGMGMAGGAAVGGIAYGMRNTVGRFSANAKQSDKLQKMAAETGVRGMLGRTLVKTANVGARASYDVRSGKMGKALGATGINFGAAGGAGGRVAQLRAKDEATVKKAEELFPNNPQAQENYIRNAMRRTPTSIAETKDLLSKGVLGGGQPSRYDDKPGKYAEKGDKVLADKKKALAEEKAEIDKKARLKKGIEEYEKLEKEGKLQELNAAGVTFGDAAAEEIKKAMAGVSGKSAGETLTEKQMQMRVVAESMDSRHLGYFNTKAHEYQPETISAVTKHVVAGGTKSGRNFVRNNAKTGGAFQFDYEGELRKTSDEYQRAADTFDPTTASQAQIAAHNAAQTERKKQAGRMLGGLEPNDIAELDENVLANEMTVNQYNTKVLGKIAEKGKNSEYAPDFADRLRTMVERSGNDSAKRWMASEKLKRDSYFFDQNAGQQNNQNP